MAKISSATFIGGSGDKYPFDVYTMDTVFTQGLPGVYCIARRYKLKNGGFTLDALYIGEREDLSTICGFHRAQYCLQQHGANCRCVFMVDDEKRRERIVEDLKDHYKPACNR